MSARPRLRRAPARTEIAGQPGEEDCQTWRNTVTALKVESVIDHVLANRHLRRATGCVRELRRARGAFALERPWQLAAREARLRSGLRVELRRWSDREALYEVFARRVYDPPRPVSPRRVLDLGANVGMFSLRATEL